MSSSFTATINDEDDERWMRLALELARAAALRGEVPVGCVVVRQGAVTGVGWNMRESLQDPTAHAEVMALRRAAASTGYWRLDDSTCYSTLEPCPMCAGALINARVRRLVFGSRDPKAGCCGSLMNLPSDTRFNHRLEISEGVLRDDCAQVLSSFFENLRQRGK